MCATVGRRLPVGAELTGTNAVDFRVWAPRAHLLEVILDDSRPAVALAPEPGGYHRGVVEGVTTGARYHLRRDGGRLLPDPASRFQPHGPHGPSCVVDPSRFPWTDETWRGLRLPGQVL